MKTFGIKNFEKFQHYRDRSPPWIKLYNDLLDDYEFAALPDASKGHLMMLWLLASRMENKIPWDAAWIGKKINARDAVDLEALERAGFIHECSIDDLNGTKMEWASRHIPEAIRIRVMVRDGHKCRQCKSIKNLGIDHVIPISKGGTGDEENLQVLCRPCNRKKRVTVVSRASV